MTDSKMINGPRVLEFMRRAVYQYGRHHFDQRIHLEPCLYVYRWLWNLPDARTPLGQCLHYAGVDDDLMEGRMTTPIEDFAWELAERYGLRFTHAGLTALRVVQSLQACGTWGDVEVLTRFFMARMYDPDKEYTLEDFTWEAVLPELGQHIGKPTRARAGNANRRRGRAATRPSCAAARSGGG